MGWLSFVVPSKTVHRLAILQEDKDCTDVDIKPVTSVLRISFRNWLYETAQ